MPRVNETHDVTLTSWVVSANGDDSDFPIQNLPFAVFRGKGSAERFRGGVAIGDQVLDLAAAKESKAFVGMARDAIGAAAQSTLNDFMGMGGEAWSALRLALSRALRSGSPEEDVLSRCLIPQANVEYGLPCRIGDYTDFYSSVYHATAVGSLFRPDAPLLPNYKWIPVGYHGRASSIRLSGHGFPRPVGQTLSTHAAEPSVGPCRRLDYEVELGMFIGTANELGERVSIHDAEDHVFGLCLLNDWTARDIQAWEYQPLGPFLGKSFVSTISPWIVTTEALAPYRAPFSRPADDPQPLPYLSSETNSAEGAIDIQLECFLETERMRSTGRAPVRLSRSSFKHSYWTMAQMVAHHTVNGCNLQPGDLLGTGTQSGPGREQAGSLLELTSGGTRPLTFENGETRTFLEDSDSIILRGSCTREGVARIGFGEAVATVRPAKP